MHRETATSQGPWAYLLHDLAVLLAQLRFEAVIFLICDNGLASLVRQGRLQKLLLRCAGKPGHQTLSCNATGGLANRLLSQVHR